MRKYICRINQLKLEAILALFKIEDKKDYFKAIIYYISGMTDNYAIDMYNKIIKV